MNNSQIQTDRLQQTGHLHGGVNGHLQGGVNQPTAVQHTLSQSRCNSITDHSHPQARHTIMCGWG